MKHRLQLVDSSLPPIRENLRRHPISYLDRIAVEVGRLLKADIVQEANDSPWASNVVLVVKRPTAEGQSPKFRITVDFRNLNNRLVGLNYPIGETSSVINSLQKAKFFHCLDLANAYLGLPLDESTSELTSFVTRRGVFKFKWLAAGLCTAPGAYAHLVNLILGDTKFNPVYPFLDDWTVIAGDFSEGLTLLKEVFDWVRQANVKFKGTKCKLFQVKAKILGLFVEDRQVSEDPVRIQKIQNWALPRTAKELRAFLGFMGFSRQFY
jgi:hypothetical protein